MPQIKSLNGYEITDEYARTQVERVNTQIGELSTTNESMITQINDLQGALDSISQISAGSATQPIYFNDGEPIATTYALNATVPSDAKFTDTTYSTATTSAAGLMSASDKTKINATTDYVVAQGTSNGWDYIKFNSGIAILSGVFVETMAHYSTWNNMYAYYTVAHTFPFKFVETPGVGYGGFIGSGFAINARAVVTDESVVFYYMASASGSQDVETQAVIMGRWK